MSPGDKMVLMNLIDQYNQVGFEMGQYDERECVSEHLINQVDEKHRKLKQEIINKINSIPSENSLVDQLDIMIDEFKRICFLTNNTEIQGLCKRAIRNIKQNVPVIEQRDEWERKFYEVNAELNELKNELTKLAQSQKHEDPKTT